jgi:hypothetical protein
VHVSSQKITHRFRHIEQVDIDRALGAEPAAASPVEPSGEPLSESIGRGAKTRRVRT